MAELPSLPPEQTESWNNTNETEKSGAVVLHNVTLTMQHHPDEQRPNENDDTTHYLVEGDTEMNGQVVHKVYTVRKIMSSAGEELSEHQVATYYTNHRDTGVAMKLMIDTVSLDRSIRAGSQNYTAEFIEN